jgi:ATP-dependent helicase HepA
MRAGDRARRKATGEDGVVLRVVSGTLLEVAFASGVVLIHAEELTGAPEGPAEMLASGQVGRAEPYGLRLQALYLKHAYRYDPLTGLTSARIEPQLHQVYVAHRVTQKLQPRMILADEVGLGKTVEAGLILKELRARQIVSRVLIVVPASLQMQWQSELRSKFNEDFEIVDGAALQFLGRGGANPWAVRPNVICSLSLAQNPKRAEQIIEADWDLVIFDEAHRVRRTLQGKSERATLAYRLADDLKESVNGLLLLTATPMQVHPFELYSLIELVEPGMFSTFRSYEQLRGKLPRLNALMKALKGWNALSAAEQDTVVRENQSLMSELGVPGPGAVALLADDAERERVMDKLVDMHPLAGALVRNRKAEVGGFTSREARKIPVALDNTELGLYQEVTDYVREGYNRAVAEKNLALGFIMVTYQKMLASSSHAVRQSFRRRIGKLQEQLKRGEATARTQRGQNYIDEIQDADEMTASLIELDDIAIDAGGLLLEIKQLEDLVQRLGFVRDSKAGALLDAMDNVFGSDPHEKVVIFTQFIETQEFLGAALRHNGYTVSLFNGRMTLEEKESAVRAFRETDQVLISTEAGGEGRNFQFCHIMINYDLPWNPMRVEQRIGRLDRIGQKRPVQIYNLFCEQTVEERVLDVLAQRIGLFQESVGSLDPILGEVERDIERLLLADAPSDVVFRQFEVDLERRVREAKEKERTLADFVLDRASLRHDIAVELIGESPLARWKDLEKFTGECLQYFGGALHDHYEGGQVITLSPRLMTRLRRRESTIRGTFDPAVARDEEELPFFAFGHSLVDTIVDLPIDVEPETTAVRSTSGVPPGEWVEVYYEIRGEGVRPSGWFIRHLVGPELVVQSHEMTAVPELGRPVPHHAPPDWVAAAVAASRERFEVDFDGASKRIAADNEAARNEALVRAERVFTYRKERLAKIIDQQRAWIAEKEETGSERERRVLPARRGQLKRNIDRLENLEREHYVELEDITHQKADATAQVLAAGVVIGS